MKNILFIIRDFNQGGIPRCLQSLLDHTDSREYKIDLLCLHQGGPYKGKMKNCVVLPQDKYLFHLLTFTDNINWRKNIKTFTLKSVNKLLGIITTIDLIHRRLNIIAKSLCNRYDCVVAYNEGIAAHVAQRISTPKKIVWIHNDYQFECARNNEGTDFGKFDNIISVSEASKISFNNTLPNYADKTSTIYNFINDAFIKESAKEAKPDIFDDRFFNIISVGRISYQKNFTIIPKILSQIPQDKRKNIRWYILGAGSVAATNNLKQEISKYDVSDSCILLGQKNNPYIYIKHADLFALTSVYESYPTVINEAKVLECPILSVDIPPAYEMLPKHCIAPLGEFPSKIVDLMNNNSNNICKIDTTKHNRDVSEKLRKLFD